MPIDKKSALEQIDVALKRYADYIPNERRGLRERNESNNLLAHSEIYACLRTTLQRLAPPGSLYSLSGDVSQLAGNLKALRADYEAGYLASYRELLHGETFSNFLDMASHLLSEGYKDAAAVIAGGVLEQHLRALCDKHTITPVPTKINALNQILYPKVYDSNWMKQVNAWGDIRNDAAHGNYQKVIAGLVETMVAGVRLFISSHPA